MGDIVRRTVDEISALYELEPSLRDIYVEGPSDAGLLKWMLGNMGLADVMIYDVNSIHLPPQLLRKHNLSGGMRDRVIALALELTSLLPEDTIQATCIADKDVDELLGSSLASHLLFYTDYGAMELYALEPDTMRKFLLLNGVNSLPAIEDFIDNLERILAFCAEMLAAKLALKWDLQKLSVDRFCTMGNDAIELDEGEAIRRTLMTRGRYGEREEFSDKMDELRSGAPDDRRLYLHGHDLVQVLKWYLRENVNQTGISENDIQRNLYSCLEYKKLNSERLFCELTKRYSPESST